MLSTSDILLLSSKRKARFMLRALFLYGYLFSLACGFVVHLNHFSGWKSLFHGFDQTLRMNGYTGATIEVTSPSEDLLQKVNISDWPLWKLARPLWANLQKVYDDQITFFVLEGNATVHPSGKYSGQSQISIEPEKLYTFPEGFSCLWEVEEDVIKRYHIPIAVDLQFPGLLPSPRIPKSPN